MQGIIIILYKPCIKMSVRVLGNATKITLIRLQKHTIHVSNNIVLFVRDQEAMCKGDQRMMKRQKMHLTTFNNSVPTWAPMSWVECPTPSNTHLLREHQTSKKTCHMRKDLTALAFSLINKAWSACLKYVLQIWHALVENKTPGHENECEWDGVMV